MENLAVNEAHFLDEDKIYKELKNYLPSPKFKLHRLENIESCWEFIENNSIESFVKSFCNETLTRVYRLIIFSSEIKFGNLFLHHLSRAIERESLKRNFDCFQLVKQDKNDVLDVIYNAKQIIYI